jgi:hypothetical protein
MEAETGSGQDLPVGAKVLQFFFVGPEEHIVGKEVPARGFVNDPDIEAMARVGADITVTYEELMRLIEPAGNGGKDAVEMSRVDGLVEVVPVDGACGDLIFYDIPVLRGTTGESARPHNERTGVAQQCFLPAKAMPGEVFRWELVMDGIGDTQTETEKTLRRESNDGR